jgi:hypothetical protein
MINQCLEILKRNEFKKEFRQIMTPLFSLLMETLKPYLICICIIIVFHTILLISILYLLITKIFYS